MISIMECNGIPYEIIEHNWNIKVSTKDFAHYLNNLIETLRKNEVINLTIYSMHSREEPIEDHAGTVYKDLKEFKVLYNNDNEIDDILIRFKDGTISLKSILNDVPKNFFFFESDDLENFSMWGSSSNNYEAVFLLLFLPNSIRRIRFNKEVLHDE